MKSELERVKESSKKDVYLLSSDYTWGTTALFLADAQKAIMYYYLTSDPAFLNTAVHQRDYFFGRNNWGVSFVIGVGEEYPLNAHSQLNSLSGLQIGGVVGGPARLNSWKMVFPQLDINSDRFAEFQSDIIYYDVQADYYCNEVAIDYAAPSVLLLLHNIAEAVK